jgi:hypothetical protein
MGASRRSKPGFEIIEISRSKYTNIKQKIDLSFIKNHFYILDALGGSIL